jgi:hypothetical protein
MHFERCPPTDGTLHRFSTGQQIRSQKHIDQLLASQFSEAQHLSPTLPATNAMGSD